MPVSFSILSHRNLALVTYEGHVTVADRDAVMQEVLRHRNFRPCQERLVDLSRVTGWEDGFAPSIREPAAQSGWLFQPDSQTLCVYYAPTPIAREMAVMLAEGWAGVPSVVSLVLEDETEALAILGQTEARLAELSVAA